MFRVAFGRAGTAAQRRPRLQRAIGPYISTPPDAACRKREITGSETMDPKSTAVVLIEYQNDFTTGGGTLHQAAKPGMDKTNMLANTVETVKRARELGATI